MKLTFMGAGSTIFARNVIGDCMCSEALRDSVFALYDIDGERLEQSRTILEAIRATLETCPPELAGDIVDHGVILTGGGALLKGISEWLTQVIEVPVHLAPEPLQSVAIGTGKSYIVSDRKQKLAK